MTRFKIDAAWVLAVIFLSIPSLHGFVLIKPAPAPIDHSEITEMTVEVAIVCDLECGRSFQHNETQIRAYWTAFMWDLHLRFQTLPNTNISFSVTSLTVMQEDDEQSFITDATTYENKINFTSAGNYFAKWMYTSHMNKIPSFDVAFAVSGLKVDGGWLAGSPDDARACNVDHTKGFINSSFIIPLRYDAPVALASYEMARQLGFTGNFISMGEAFTFGSGGFVDDMSSILEKSPTLANTLPKILDSRKFYFNEEAMEPIHTFLASEQAECLRRKDSTQYSIAETNRLSIAQINPVSLDRQCQIYANSEHVIVDLEKSHCNMASCIVTDENNETGVKTLHPIDGVTCKDNGRCFRGRCYQPGLQLVNVVTGECLIAGNKISSSNGPYIRFKPEMIDCSKAAASPLHQFSIRDVPHLGELVVTPYDGIGVVGWLSNSTGDLDVCLMEILTKNESSGQHNGSLIFWNCEEAKAASGIVGPLVGWALIGVGDPSQGEFLLAQRHSNRCVKAEVSSNDGVVTSSNCFSNDPRLRWKLVYENGTVDLAVIKVHHSEVIAGDSDSDAEIVIFSLIAFVILVMSVLLMLRVGPKLWQRYLDSRVPAPVEFENGTLHGI